MNRQVHTVSSRIYTILVCLSSCVYGLGICLWAPPTSPVWLKFLMIGGVSLVLLLIASGHLRQLHQQDWDERCLTNFLKAASLLLVEIFLVGLLLALALFMSQPIQLGAGLILVVLAALLFQLGLLFFYFEQRG